MFFLKISHARRKLPNVPAAHCPSVSPAFDCVIVLVLQQHLLLEPEKDVGTRPSCAQVVDNCKVRCKILRRLDGVLLDVSELSQSC